MAKTAKDYALKGTPPLHATLTAAGYCLWLIPDAETEPGLQALIRDLAGLEAGAPTFQPHITLLSPKNRLCDSASGIQEALERAVAATPRARGPMQLTLEKPEPGTFYYQCVLAPVVPTEELLALREYTERACEDQPPMYFPHLSLLYGDLTDERKRELCDEAAKRHSFPLRITVKEAVVVDVNGVADEWKVVARVAL